MRQEYQPQWQGQIVHLLLEYQQGISLRLILFVEIESHYLLTHYELYLLTLLR